MTLGLLFVLSDFRYIPSRAGISTNWIKLRLNVWALLDSGKQEKYMAPFCGWSITWNDPVHKGWTDPGDRPLGKPAKGVSVSRLLVLERGLKYRRVPTIWISSVSPESRLFHSCQPWFERPVFCNRYDEVAVLILDFQYPCACTGRAHPSLVKAAHPKHWVSSVWVSKSLRQSCRVFSIF